jgi:formate dehydrogenase major subunit
MISLTIDEKTIEVKPGTTVLRAAEMAGIHIPTLCDHPELTPYGGCRLCIVEIQGFRIPVTSCTMPASQGMVVKTNTPNILASRQQILSLLFSERNHFCPFCQLSGGDCELQNAALDEGMTHWPMSPVWKTFSVDTSHPYFILDNNRCILCRRCVRACGELVGNFTLAVADRGTHSMLVADGDLPLGESSCISCGNCVQVCPTGALIDRQSAYLGLEKDLEITPSICIGCSVGCGVKLFTRDNQLVRIEGDWEAPVNCGVLCKTGRFKPLEYHRQRLTIPMLRQNGELQPTSWDEALWAIVDHLRPLVGRKEDGIAALASTRLPIESLTLFKCLFADRFQSSMVTSVEEGRPTALLATMATEMRQPFEGTLDSLHTADCVVAIGVNLVESHEVAGFFVKRALQKGLKLVVIDPQPNDLDQFAAYTIKPVRGSDVDVLLALQAAVVDEDLAKVSPPAFDAEKILASLPARTGLNVRIIREVARLIGTARQPVIIFGKGITARSDTETLRMLIKLARLIGAFDDDHSGLISVKGEANSLAATQLGLDQPFQLNGNKAVFVALGDDYPSQRLIQRLEKAPFLVVQASYESNLTKIADVVLPVEMWAEQDGHFLNLDGRLQLARHALRAPEGAWAHRTVFTALADRLNLNISANWKEELHKRVPSVAISED